MPVFWVYEPTDSPHIYKFVDSATAKNSCEAVFFAAKGKAGCLAITREQLRAAGLANAPHPKFLKITGGVFGEPLKIFPTETGVVNAAQTETPVHH